MRCGRLVWLGCVCAAFAPTDAAAGRLVDRYRNAAAEADGQQRNSAPPPSAPKVPDLWLGIKVMPRTPTARLGLPDRATARASDVAPWPQTVRKVHGRWLWIETDTAKGWIKIQDVVPLADAIRYFNGQLAQRTAPWELYMRGSALREQERFGETYRDFKALEKIEEQQTKSLMSQAAAQSQRKDYRGMIATMDQVARLAPSNALIYTARGDAYLMLNDLARAKADYDHAVELAASTATYSARANYYRRQGDFERAIVDLDKAIYHWPLIRLYEQRAECLLSRKDYARAIDDLNVVLAHNPRKVKNYLHRGHAYLASGATRDGDQDLSTAIRLAPTADTYKAVDEVRFACQDLRRAVANEP